MPDNSLAKIELKESPLYSGYYNLNAKIEWYDYGVRYSAGKALTAKGNPIAGILNALLCWKFSEI